MENRDETKGFSGIAFVFFVVCVCRTFFFSFFPIILSLYPNPKKKSSFDHFTLTKCKKISGYMDKFDVWIVTLF